VYPEIPPFDKGIVHPDKFRNINNNPLREIIDFFIIYLLLCKGKETKAKKSSIAQLKLWSLNSKFSLT
jgi:hypothetical protein